MSQDISKQERLAQTLLDVRGALWALELHHEARDEVLLASCMGGLEEQIRGIETTVFRAIRIAGERQTDWNNDTDHNPAAKGKTMRQDLASRLIRKVREDNLDAARLAVELLASTTIGNLTDSQVSKLVDVLSANKE